MPLKTELLQEIKHYLCNLTGYETDVKSVTPVSGGSINAAYCIDTGIEKYMLKVNNKNAYPNMFACEAAGLDAIRETKTIAVPEVIYQNDVGDDSFLLLEWIETRRTTDKASVELGRQLALMHRHTNECFRFDTDNYMGSLTQSNRKRSDWKSFFTEERLCLW